MMVISGRLVSAAVSPSADLPAMTSPTRQGGGRAEYAARALQELVEEAAPGDHLGTKVVLQSRFGVSVGTFNEAIRLAQSRGYVTSRSGPGGGLFAAEQSAIVRLGNSFLALDGSATSVADAVRMRDALDPLLVDDALRHSSEVAIDKMRHHLDDMATARDTGDAVAFVRANWALHRSIAEVSPSAILRSTYISLLELLADHTQNVVAAEGKSLPEFVAARYTLHEQLVDAIDQRDHETAQYLITEHNNTDRSN